MARLMAAAVVPALRAARLMKARTLRLVALDTLCFLAMVYLLFDVLKVIRELTSSLSFCEDPYVPLDQERLTLSVGERKRVQARSELAPLVLLTFGGSCQGSWPVTSFLTLLVGHN